ncbi:armadillo-type protein [Mycena crocata]|nr:armadillo-type protein [Mycena crocata]
MASTPAPPPDVLSAVFAGLKNKNPDVRLQSAIELRRYVAARNRGGGMGDGIANDEDGISRRLFELIHSQNSVDNLGGLMAIDHLIDGSSSSSDPTSGLDTHHNLFRFYNYVKHLLPNPDPTSSSPPQKPSATSSPSSSSLLKLLLLPLLLHILLLPLLLLLDVHGPPSPRRHLAHRLRLHLAFGVVELALNMPAQFHAHLPAVLDQAVLAPLRDGRLVVREAAAELLAACLEIGGARAASGGSYTGASSAERAGHGAGTRGDSATGSRAGEATGPPYLTKILADAQAGLKYSQPEVIHGSLLAYRELLLHAGAFMTPHFLESADAILAFRANRDPAVRRMVVAMIPTLASYNTPAFKEHILHKAMSHLLGQLEKGNERDYALISIGHTATAVGADMKPFLESVMGHIKARLKESAAVGGGQGVAGRT